MSKSRNRESDKEEKSDIQHATVKVCYEGGEHKTASRGFGTRFLVNLETSIESVGNIETTLCPRNHMQS